MILSYCLLAVVVDRPLKTTMVVLEKLCMSQLWNAQENAQLIKHDINAERLDKVTLRASVLRFAVEPKINNPFEVVLDGLAAGGEVLLLEIFKNMVYTSVLSCLHKRSLSVACLW